MAERAALTCEAAQQALLSGPFHQWLGLEVLSVGDGEITIRAAWREEWVGHPKRRYTHGGILASLIDLTADWALVSRLGSGAPTIDLRIDYHRPAAPGDLTTIGRVIKFGRQISFAEAKILDKAGALVASGRGVYMTGPAR